jgi:hypothetical protein
MDIRTVHTHVGGSGHSFLRTGADGAGAVGVRGPRLGLVCFVICTREVRILTVPTRVGFFLVID